MLRWIGRILGLFGLGFMVGDLAIWNQEGETRFVSIGEWWFWAHPDSLQVAQPAIERHIAPWLWDPVVQTILLWPLSITILVIAGICIAIGRLRGQG
ncbi:MAG: hypothetical protein AAGB15_05275 [Pseudomonadota bacterium]